MGGTHMGDEKYKIFVGKPEDKRRWEDISIYILRKESEVWIGFIWLRIGTSGGIL
jgi:hypothetical protein